MLRMIPQLHDIVYISQVRQKLQIGPLMKGLIVNVVDIGDRDCFLDTEGMGMRYLTQAQDWAYGNVSRTY